MAAQGSPAMAGPDFGLFSDDTDDLPRTLRREKEARAREARERAARERAAAPTLSTGIKEADTGRSAFHVEARRDAKFRALQKLRFDVGLYAVLGAAIMDL